MMSITHYAFLLSMLPSLNLSKSKHASPSINVQSISFSIWLHGGPIRMQSQPGLEVKIDEVVKGENEHLAVLDSLISKWET